MLRDGAAQPETKRLREILLQPIGIGAVVCLMVSALQFVERVYRIRQFLIDRGKLQFADWPLTVIAFGFPIANFFVPWNRFDVIRETLRRHRDTGKLEVVSRPEKKLRMLGIIWGINSLFTVQGDLENATWKPMVLAGGLVSTALSAWTFYIAVRWLSELQSDFEQVTR